MRRGRVSEFEVLDREKALEALSFGVPEGPHDGGHNHIGDEGVQHFAANTSITSLDLSDNLIGDEGAIQLAANPSIPSSIYATTTSVRLAKKRWRRYAAASLSFSCDDIGWWPVP